MYKEIYNKLDLLSPGFLRKDVFKYAKSSSLYAESLQSFTDAELPRVKWPNCTSYPKPEKNLTKWKEQSGKASDEVQLASNFSTYTTHRVSRNTLTIGNISNPYGRFEVSPALCLGGGSWAECLQTWRNTWKQISAMSTKSSLTREDCVESSNIANAPRFAAGNPLSENL